MTDTELTDVVLEAVRCVPGLTPTTLRKALPIPYQRHVRRPLANQLLERLEAQGRVRRDEDGGYTVSGAEEVILQQLVRLHDRGRIALIVIPELRAATGLPKPAFDRAILDLQRRGRVSLHLHDSPGSLPKERRELLVRDGDIHYVGVALHH